MKQNRFFHNKQFLKETLKMSVLTAMLFSVLCTTFSKRSAYTFKFHPLPSNSENDLKGNI